MGALLVPLICHLKLFYSLPPTLVMWSALQLTAIGFGQFVLMGLVVLGCVWSFWLLLLLLQTTAGSATGSALPQ